MPAAEGESVLVPGDGSKSTPAEPPPPVPPPSAAVLSDLAQRLRHRDATVRRAAAAGLGRLGAGARPAIPALLLAACDGDGAVRTTAAAALDRVDSAWPTDPGAAAAVPALVTEMGRRSPDVSQAAALLLHRIGPAAVPGLAGALTGGAGDLLQVLVARTLGRIGAGAAPAVPALARALASEFAHVRQAAAEALAGVGPAAEPATPALVLALADWQPMVRQAAARCVAGIGGAASLAIPGLVQLLADRVDEVRDAAVEALGRVGPAAVPGLIAMAEARDLDRMREWLRWQVEVSDWCTRPVTEDFQREPLKALRNARWHFSQAGADHERVEAVHEAALRALGKVGPGAAAAVAVLGQALADANPRLRLAAARALGQVGPPASAALPALARRLIDGSKPVRLAAAEALGKIDAGWASGDPVQEAVRDLAPALKKSGDEGQVAVDAFAAVGAAAVPVLVEALASGDRIVREAAATALGRIGPAARAAIPALRQATQDSHDWVRDAAARALREVGKEAT